MAPSTSMLASARAAGCSRRPGRQSRLHHCRQCRPRSPATLILERDNGDGGGAGVGPPSGSSPTIEPYRFFASSPLAALPRSSSSFESVFTRPTMPPLLVPFGAVLARRVTEGTAHFVRLTQAFVAAVAMEEAAADEKADADTCGESGEGVFVVGNRVRRGGAERRASGDTVGTAALAVGSAAVGAVTAQVKW